jgi:hypothetical protein
MIAGWYTEPIMQVTQAQPETLMLFPNVAQGAHQAILSKSPDQEDATETVKPGQSKSSAAHLSNSLDILV